MCRIPSNEADGRYSLWNCQWYGDLYDGCDIRTGKGFPKERFLFVLKSYELSEEETKSLFSIRHHSALRGKIGLLHVYIVNGLFVLDGL